MAFPEVIVADTSALYALASETDEFHEPAFETLVAAVAADVEFWTTSYALVETIALIHRRLGFDQVTELLAYVERNVRVFWIESKSHASALRQFVRQGGTPLSLVDWTIVLCAQSLSAGVFTFEKGFAGHGLTVIPL